jgi:hypothetical protein
VTPDRDPHAASSRLVGISLLLTAKGMDLATTASVVLARPAAEANPIPAEVMVNSGVPGLVVLSLLACGAVVVVTEAAAWRLRTHGPLAPVVARLSAYGLLTALWTAVAIRNAQAIAGVLA